MERDGTREEKIVNKICSDLKNAVNEIESTDSVKKNDASSEKEKKKVFWKSIFECFLYFMIGFSIYLIVFSLKHPFFVSGTSMYPTLQNMEIVLCTPISDVEIKRYDIVVLKNERQKIIKRVIGLPGDTVLIENNTVYINGEPEEVFYEDTYLYNDATYKSVTLKKDEYFVLGDNRDESYDSRNIGPVHISNIKYRVNQKDGRE